MSIARPHSWLKAIQIWIAGYMERSDMCPVDNGYGKCLKDISLQGVLTDTPRVCPLIPETPCGVPGYPNPWLPAMNTCQVDII